MAAGNDNDLIVLRHDQQATETALWEGITFDNTGKRQNRLDHVKIQDTKVAIRAISSSPEIRHTILTGNETALLITELSEPHIEANAITNNRQNGIISHNATPTIMRNDITHNAGNGITLAASSPVMLENNVHSNTGYQLFIDGTGEAIVSVQNNWWGTTDREQLQRLISGPVSYAKVLNAPYPNGRSIALPSRVQTMPAPVATAPAAAPVASADELIARGETALHQDQPAEALSAFTQALSLQPDNHKLIFRVGVIHYQLGHPTEAMQAMQRAASLQPDDAGYAYHLGLVYSELGMSEKAVAAWEHVLAIRPEHRNARMLLALEQRNLSQ
jgi:tetratricopeptide (TPR) repeat protein